MLRPDFLPMRQVYLHRDEEDWWIAEVPSLPGCVSQGRSREEALTNIRDAITGVIASMRDQGRVVPDDPLDADLVTVEA